MLPEGRHLPGFEFERSELMDSGLERYAKQVLFAGLGEEGQRRLMRSRVLVCGCGALGSVIAETVVRAGVGFVRIVDRDFVELSNLQRQVLYDEQDVAERLPKAIAAANKLRRINSTVTVEPVVADVNATSALELVRDVEAIVDGTDNFEVRFLLNDVSLETGVPWVYGGVIGSHGQTMTIVPGRTACLRCLIEAVPEPGMTETCDTAGVLGGAVNVVASLEAVEAMKLLSGHADLVSRALTVIDVWDGSFQRMSLEGLRERSDCPACVRGERPWLSGQMGSQTTVLCGRNAVQVSPSGRLRVDFDELGAKLRSVGRVESNAWLLRLELREPAAEVTVFRDGRAIVKGTEDAAVARSLYARYVGS